MTDKDKIDQTEQATDKRLKSAFEQLNAEQELQPSAELDALIMQQAAEAISSESQHNSTDSSSEVTDLSFRRQLRDENKKRKSVLPKWAMPMAMAATVLVTSGIFLRVLQSPEFDSIAQQASSAPVYKDDIVMVEESVAQANRRDDLNAHESVSATKGNEDKSSEALLGDSARQERMAADAVAQAELKTKKLSKDAVARQRQERNQVPQASYADAEMKVDSVETDISSESLAIDASVTSSNSGNADLVYEPEASYAQRAAAAAQVARQKERVVESQSENELAGFSVGGHTENTIVVSASPTKPEYAAEASSKEKPPQPVLVSTQDAAAKVASAPADSDDRILAKMEVRAEIPEKYDDTIDVTGTRALSDKSVVLNSPSIAPVIDQDADVSTQEPITVTAASSTDPYSGLLLEIEFEHKACQVGQDCQLIIFDACNECACLETVNRSKSNLYVEFDQFSLIETFCPDSEAVCDLGYCQVSEKQDITEQ